MKLIIDISKELYTNILATWKDIHPQMHSILKNGTPLPKEEWIPVSDPLNELPTDRRLLVTVLEDYGSRYVTELYYDMTEWNDIHYARNAIAYMSYPEPYRAESEK